ncbi:hypothetical protein D9M71_420150 [compost metagenome]
MWAQQQRLVVQLVGCLCPIGGEEAIEVTLTRCGLVKQRDLRVAWLCQLQAASLPVLPAAAAGQVLGKAFGQLVGVLPAAQAQQQAKAPFADSVVTQLGVIAGHQVERAWVVAACEGQADFAGDGHLFVTREVHALGVIVEQRHGPLRVLPGQATKAEADHVGHGLVDRGKARRLVEQLGLLRHVDQQAPLRAEGGQGIDQVVGQAIVARLGRQLGALPALGLGQLAFGRPHAEQRVARGRLRLADVPQFVGGGVALGTQAVAELVLAVEAVQFGEVELGVVVLDEGVPLATFG